MQAAKKNEEWSQGEHDGRIGTNEKIDLKIKLKVQWVSLRIQFLVGPGLSAFITHAELGQIYLLWKIKPKLLRDTGLTRLGRDLVFGHRILPENTHYPSTPELKASRLSSAVARPVRANTFARPCTTDFGGTLNGPPGGETIWDSDDKALFLSASIFLISRVASWPFITGMVISMRMTLGTESAIVGAGRWRFCSLEVLGREMAEDIDSSLTVDSFVKLHALEIGMSSFPTHLCKTTHPFLQECREDSPVDDVILDN